MNDFHAEITELKLREPFGLSRGRKCAVQNLFVRINGGYGEGAPVYYQGQHAEDMISMFNQWAESSPELDASIEPVIDDLMLRFPGQTGLAMAVDLALHDKMSIDAGTPLHDYLTIPWREPLVSSFTIGLDEPDVVLEKVEQAASYPILKIKTGSDDDIALLGAIRQKTDKPLRIDANEGWTLDQTLYCLPILDDRGVEFLEQPLPRSEVEGYGALIQKNPTKIPIFIDEGLYGPDTLDRWSGRVDGINVKLAKCGGIARALKLIDRARGFNLKVMLGCMIESSLAITAAAHLAPLADYLDLDGAALLSNDPYEGMVLKNGHIVMPQRPGIGAKSVLY